MNRLQYFGLGFISLALGTLSLSVVVIETKTIGVDALVLVIMGQIFFGS